MLNRGPQQKRATRRVDWLVVGVGFVFALVILTASLLAYYYFTSTRIATPAVSTPIPTNTAPAATATSTPTPEPVATEFTASATPVVYIVKPGDTLSGIAAAFGVTVDALKLANALASDTIYADQVLVIPGGALVSTPLASSVTVVPPNVTRYQVTEGDTLERIALDRGVSADALRSANAMVGDALIAGQFISIPQGVPAALPWRFSSLSGDLKRAYPLAVESERFILHYQPETFPAQDPEMLARMESESLAYLESLTGLSLGVSYDVYVAGSVFESPNQALRGITYSSFQKTFFLHDGTGNAADQRYIATHELTHLFLWNTLGAPASTLLSEGAAVYTGLERIQDSQHVPVEVFCALYAQAGTLPDLTASPTFLGHIADLQNYYAAGSFVKYLVETYGIESFKAVYHNGNYAAVYGKGLPVLAQEWRASLADVPVPDGLDPAAFVGAVRTLETAYRNFFAVFAGRPQQLQAYRELDRARIALLEGDLAAMQNALDAFTALR